MEFTVNVAALMMYIAKGGRGLYGLLANRGELAVLNVTLAF